MNTKLVIGVALIIALSILGFGYMNYKGKMAIIENDNYQQTLKDLQYQRCRDNAQADYILQWNAQCPVQGIDKLTDDCTLPRFIAQDIETKKTKDLENCVKMYGN